MKLIKIDPRALRENPNPSRRTKSSPQSDALMLASIRALGIIQPPIVYATPGGDNEMTIHVGSRRVRLSVAADLPEIPALVIDPETEGGLMRELVENVAREALNPVDLWRSIERLTAEDWTEEAIVTALALPIRQVKKLRLLAKLLPAMLDHIAKGDMPEERYLRLIAAATPEEQASAWKKHKPTKAEPRVAWWELVRPFTRQRMFARDASFGDDLAQAYGITWSEDLFDPADQDNRYTTDVEAYLGAQQEWMANHLPKRGVILEVSQYGEAKLPPKAERVYGERKKTDTIGHFLDRNGTIQTIAYRMPAPAKPKKGTKGAARVADEAITEVRTPRPDVSRKGLEMIGQLRTDALHEALRVAPMEHDTLLALMVLAVSGRNVSVASAASGDIYGHARFDQQAEALLGEDGRLDYDLETLHRAARSTLIELFSCKLDRTQSGVAALIAGQAIGAQVFLPSMATEEYLACLSRPALEAVGHEVRIQPKPRVRETRAAIVKHYEASRLVHDAALFDPTEADVASLRNSVADAKARAARIRSNDEGVDEPDIDPSEQEEGDADHSDQAEDSDENEHLMAAE